MALVPRSGLRRRQRTGRVLDGAVSGLAFARRLQHRVLQLRRVGQRALVERDGRQHGARNFLWDFYFYVDNASQTATQSLEFDAFQFVGGYNYMMGSQCDYGHGVWDTYDAASGHWIPTSISCPKFSPNTWHHIQWYITTNTGSHNYKFVMLVVDGHSYPVNTTHNARCLGWGDNVGVQWQLDVNATGQGCHEWVDTATLTVW